MPRIGAARVVLPASLGACSLGACVGAVLATLLTASPAQAFGLRLGPFHIGIPFPFHRYHHLYMRASPSETAHSEGAQAASAALLYPNLALSAIFADIFETTAAPAWPFGYRDIFATAFGKLPETRDQRACARPDDANTDAKTIVDKISATVQPTQDQMASLQKLGGAIGAASGYLAKSCPSAIPPEPVARIKLMQSQIEILAVALDMVRPPLQDFQQSLNDEQRARFAAMIAPAASERDSRSGAVAASCSGLPSAIDWSVHQIDQRVEPTAEQRAALDDMKQSFGAAVSDLQAHCPSAVPPTALDRLEAIQARLDSTWRALLSIQVALTDFATKLTDAQKDRFNSMTFAAR